MNSNLNLVIIYEFEADLYLLGDHYSRHCLHDGYFLYLARKEMMIQKSEGAQDGYKAYFH